MQVSTLVKNLLKYVPVLIVMLVAVTGILLAKNIHSLNPDLQILHTQAQTELNNSEFTILSRAMRPCMSLQIYTSLPPKCRASDGSFVQFHSLPSNIITLPGPR